MKLGIDVGAFSAKVVVIGDDGKIVNKIEQPHHNKVKEVILQILKQLPQNDYEICTSGSMSHLLNLPDQCVISEEKAYVSGIKVAAPSAHSAVILGAQKTYYFDFQQKGIPEIRKNSNCSAGTGAFFEEQATRLQISLEDISKTVSQAKSIPQIAGRCSVFSKSDMIHRMQEGESTADILNGLCYALVRNYKSNILHNKGVETPVLLCGGVMKNSGVVNALKDLLELKDDDFILDENADFIAATGCAVCAQKSFSLNQLSQFVEKETTVIKNNIYKPLNLFESDKDSPEFTVAAAAPGEKTVLGIDIGSTSINLVLINNQRQVLYYSYVKTLGRPLDIVQSEIQKLKEKMPEVQIEKISVTGSGREYIGKAVGAALVINEISAQTEGAVLANRNIDTIFEIGGQDSKYMQIKNGKMIDFEMNKVCAAGTGAFLEEQIKKLGISMSDFMTLAMKSQHPCQLGNRCTVFIEGSINRALAEGNSMEDVCAGLAYAIASNYLHRVVNQKVVGENIALQGGIAFNKAVICAFRALTGKQIHVTPFFSVTGALGAASLCLNHTELKFDKAKNQELNARLLKSSEESYLLNYHEPVAGSGKKIVGVPRVIFLHKMFPLFNTLFTKLGFDVRISPLTNQEIINKAQEYVTAETCYPIKLIYGHIAWLLEQGVDYIVLPRLYTIKHKGSVARKDYACMYMQTSPLLIEQAFHLKERGVQLIMPELSLQFGKKFMVKSIVSIADQIGVPKIRMIPAAVQAFASLVAHSNRLEQLGKESLEGDEPIFVLISRVYNIIDPALNMGIEKHLNEMGCRVVHLEHLEASYMNVPHIYKDMYWPFGQHILTGLKIIKSNKNFYPIYITNHGCGPDTAIQHFFQNEMKDREYLQLEVDEHASKVGIITRLEAFLYSLQPQKAFDMSESVYGKEENNKADFTLIPDFGIYSEVIEKHLPENHAPVLQVQPLKQHKNFNYAMNKEYFSHLVMLEEILNTVEKDKVYDLYFPNNEGSEVFGQYAFLISEELKKRGYKINLKNFYLEDLIKRNDYKEIFDDLIKAEQKQLLNSLSQNTSPAKTFVLGEPLCVFKNAICKADKLPENCLKMPFSEALLFHMICIDRNSEFAGRISEWKNLHNKAMFKAEKENEPQLYTSIVDLFASVKGKLDFMNGNCAKYRFAKLLCMNPEKVNQVIILNSAEENSQIVLNQIQESYKKEIKVPYIKFDLDFEHGIERN